MAGHCKCSLTISNLRMIFCWSWERLHSGWGSGCGCHQGVEITGGELRRWEGAWVQRGLLPPVVGEVAGKKGMAVFAF